jgi:hypothetical protein
MDASLSTAPIPVHSSIPTRRPVPDLTSPIKATGFPPVFSPNGPAAYSGNPSSYPSLQQLTPSSTGNIQTSGRRPAPSPPTDPTASKSSSEAAPASAPQQTWTNRYGQTFTSEVNSPSTISTTTATSATATPRESATQYIPGSFETVASDLRAERRGLVGATDAMDADLQLALELSRQESQLNRRNSGTGAVSAAGSGGPSGLEQATPGKSKGARFPKKVFQMSD